MASFSPSEKCYATGIYPEQDLTMTEPFTARQVRDHASADDYIGAWRKVLRAFADRLEADEKAVPVAWLRDSGVDIESEAACITSTVRNLWLASNPKRVERYTIPLYTSLSPHKGATHCDNCGCTWLDDGNNPIGCPYCKAATSDTERLAEALRNMLDVVDPAHWPTYVRDAKKALATHSAKAQSPAVSLTFATPETEEDVMAYLQVAKLHIKRFRETLQAALAAHSAQAQSASEGAMSPDAETLIGQHVSCIRAEALAIQKGVNPLNCAERIVGRCDKLAEKIRESAQPPAASVTHAMVERAQDCLHDKGKDIGYYHMRAALEAALAAQENPNG